MVTQKVSVSKETKESRLGIVFRREHKTLPLLIGDFRESNAFHDTPLRRGMKVIRINGEYVSHRKASEASAIVRNLEAGTVTIEAEGVVATVEKPSKEAKLGIGLKAIPEPPCVVIEAFSPDSMFSDCGLKPGQRIVTINDHKISDSSREAIDLLRNAEGEVQIVAIDLGFEDYDPEKAIEVTIQKPLDDSRLGLTFRRISDKPGVTITKICKNGLAWNTPLKVGQRILSINGQKPSTARDTTKLFKEASSDVTILVVDQAS